MDTKEAHTYLETARDQKEEAEIAFNAGKYALSVCLSASSAENSASAIILIAGAKPSKKHRNSVVLMRLSPTFPQETRDRIRTIIQALTSLEPHITKARYPIPTGIQFTPPSKYYRKEDAETALTEAEEVLKAANMIIQ